VVLPSSLSLTVRYDDLTFRVFNRVPDAAKPTLATDGLGSGIDDRRRNIEPHMIHLCIADCGITIIRILRERIDAPHHLKCLSWL
jgi:toxin ParE1/3/4